MAVLIWEKDIASVIWRMTLLNPYLEESLGK